VLSIQYGEHPKNIQRKLMNFIPPEMREGATEESGD
jgi:flagellar motor component MotA